MCRAAVEGAPVTSSGTSSQDSPSRSTCEQNAHNEPLHREPLHNEPPPPSMGCLSIHNATQGDEMRAVQRGGEVEYSPHTHLL